MLMVDTTTPPGNDRNPDKKIKVVFIAGAGRSGSTLLGQLLGQVDNWFAAGEIYFLWDRLLENSLCGCEQSLYACPVWGQVAKAMANLSEAEIQYLIQARDSNKVRPQGLAGGEVRLRNVWRRLAGKREFYDAEQAEKLVQQVGRAFQAIANVTGAKVIVDTSKSSAHGYILQQLDNIDLYEIHIVRNPKAVAFSWANRNKIYDILEGQPRYFPQRKIHECVADWIWSNIAAESLFSQAVKMQRYQRIRYEDLVRTPRRVLEKVINNIDSDATCGFVNDDDTVIMESNHMVAGNPSRFSKGKTRLQIDEEWRHKLPRDKKLLITAVSFPLMLRYGYWQR